MGNSESKSTTRSGGGRSSPSPDRSGGGTRSHSNGSGKSSPGGGGGSSGGGKSGVFSVGCCCTKNKVADVKSSRSGAPRVKGACVLLNVYSLQGSKAGTPLNSKLGFGIYHTGVEILNREWCFGGHPGYPSGLCGIFPIPPKSALPPTKFVESVALCVLPSSVTEHDVADIIDGMRANWPANSYHMLKKNCNHFSMAFRDEIEKFLQQRWASRHSGREHDDDDDDEDGPVMVKPYPAYINRAARLADTVVPERLYQMIMRSVPQPPMPQGAGGAQSGTPPCRNAEEKAPIVIPLKSREEMAGMTAREIKTMMWVNGVSWDGCVEKEDLIQAVEAFVREREALSQPSHAA